MRATHSEIKNSAGFSRAPSKVTETILSCPDIPQAHGLQCLLPPTRFLPAPSNAHNLSSERRDADKRTYERLRHPHRLCREYALEDGRRSREEAAALTRKRMYADARVRLEDARLCFDWAGGAEEEMQELDNVGREVEVRCMHSCPDERAAASFGLKLRVYILTTSTRVHQKWVPVFSRKPPLFRNLRPRVVSIPTHAKNPGAGKRYVRGPSDRKSREQAAVYDVEGLLEVVFGAF